MGKKVAGPTKVSPFTATASSTSNKAKKVIGIFVCIFNVSMLLFAIVGPLKDYQWIGPSINPFEKSINYFSIEDATGLKPFAASQFTLDSSLNVKHLVLSEGRSLATNPNSSRKTTQYSIPLDCNHKETIGCFSAKTTRSSNDDLEAILGAASRGFDSIVCTDKIFRFNYRDRGSSHAAGIKNIERSQTAFLDNVNSKSDAANAYTRGLYHTYFHSDTNYVLSSPALDKELARFRRGFNLNNKTICEYVGELSGVLGLQELGRVVARRYHTDANQLRNMYKLNSSIHDWDKFDANGKNLEFRKGVDAITVADVEFTAKKLQSTEPTRKVKSVHIHHNVEPAILYERLIHLQEQFIKASALKKLINTADALSYFRGDKSCAVSFVSLQNDTQVRKKLSAFSSKIGFNGVGIDLFDTKIELSSDSSTCMDRVIMNVALGDGWHLQEDNIYSWEGGVIKNTSLSIMSTYFRPLTRSIMGLPEISSGFSTGVTLPINFGENMKSLKFLVGLESIYTFTLRAFNNVLNKSEDAAAAFNKLSTIDKSYMKDKQNQGTVGYYSRILDIDTTLDCLIGGMSTLYFRRYTHLMSSGIIYSTVGQCTSKHYRITNLDKGVNSVDVDPSYGTVFPITSSILASSFTQRLIRSVYKKINIESTKYFLNLQSDSVKKQNLTKTYKGGNVSFESELISRSKLLYGMSGWHNIGFLGSENEEIQNYLAKNSNFTSAYYKGILKNEFLKYARMPYNKTLSVLFVGTTWGESLNTTMVKQFVSLYNTLLQSVIEELISSKEFDRFTSTIKDLSYNTIAEFGIDNARIFLFEASSWTQKSAIEGIYNFPRWVNAVKYVPAHGKPVIRFLDTQRSHAVTKFIIDNKLMHTIDSYYGYGGLLASCILSYFSCLAFTCMIKLLFSMKQLNSEIDWAEIPPNWDIIMDISNISYVSICSTILGTRSIIQLFSNFDGFDVYLSRNENFVWESVSVEFAKQSYVNVVVILNAFACVWFFTGLVGMFSRIAEVHLKRQCNHSIVNKMRYILAIIFLITYYNFATKQQYLDENMEILVIILTLAAVVLLILISLLLGYRQNKLNSMTRSLEILSAPNYLSGSYQKSRFHNSTSIFCLPGNLCYPTTNSKMRSILNSKLHIDILDNKCNWKSIGYVGKVETSKCPQKLRYWYSND